MTINLNQVGNDITKYFNEGMSDEQIAEALEPHTVQPSVARTSVQLLLPKRQNMIFEGDLNDL